MFVGVRGGTKNATKTRTRSPRNVRDEDKNVPRKDDVLCSMALLDEGPRLQLDGGEGGVGDDAGSR